MDPRVVELAPIIESFGLGAPTIAEVRERFHATASQIPAPEGVEVEHTTVAGLAATRIRRGDRPPAGRVLHLHGGAFVIGSVEVQLGVPARLALATGHEVVSVDYRVAPEAPLPAATDDAVAAYRTLLDEGPVDAVSGDSAGGALAVLAAVALRDAGVPLPGALLAFSPWTDLAGTYARPQTPSFEDAVLPRGFLAMAAEAALGDRTADDPQVTPTWADLRGLPPTMVHVGGDEMLLGDSVALAEDLASSGVEVALRSWPGMIHVFVAYPSLAPESDAALAEAATFLAAHPPPGT
ncbi:alpha/beta hydrolase fold domain-containing protein [Iamia majanohamensis]|uniref:Alpha/beta hydrolase fold domain-containing protein n=1 Tax=Iamia majanohamensis TaxID=467976 RepID=A0AAF0BV65_9ACTN|nr:alpha/beta hydrolase fold domain-containing protein [Iamia majanohamensis]WCO66788.1 alpha/beta hydrolase fold domain-containing protein [Iamia majanohamensis]